MTFDELLEIAYRFIDGGTFDIFRDEIAAALPSLEDSTDPLVVDLTAGIRLLFAEYGRGHRTAAEVRQRLGVLLPGRVIFVDWTLSGGPPMPSAGSTNGVTVQEGALSFAGVGR